MSVLSRRSSSAGKKKKRERGKKEARGPYWISYISENITETANDLLKALFNILAESQTNCCVSTGIWVLDKLVNTSNTECCEWESSFQSVNVTTCKTWIFTTFVAEIIGRTDSFVKTECGINHSESEDYRLLFHLSCLKVSYLVRYCLSFFTCNNLSFAYPISLLFTCNCFHIVPFLSLNL